MKETKSWILDEEDIKSAIVQFVQARQKATTRHIRESGICNNFEDFKITFDVVEGTCLVTLD